MTRTEDHRHFFRLAFEYYLLGRAAILNGLIFVAPNLIHHAVELLIKFTILKNEPENEWSAVMDELRSRKRYGHGLGRLWGRYKQAIAPADLSRFDRVIVDLNKWEGVRYGGFPNSISTTRFVGLVAGQPGEGEEPEDVYMLGLQEVDDLIAEMFAAAHLNPAFVGTAYRHQPAIREWYLAGNRHIMPNLFGGPDPALAIQRDDSRNTK